MNGEEIAARLVHAERRIKSTQRIAVLLALLFLAACISQAWELHRVANRQTLNLRRLNIVDEHGVARVVLASPVPEPIVLGKQYHRGGAASGVIIADGTGTERGGYLTSDGDAPNAFLTLDGQNKQTVVLLAEPTGDTLFRIWKGDNGSLTMGVGDNPFLNERQNGNLVFASPPNNPQSRDTRPMLR
ncbi:MAG TPA: hypothetical protein VEJ46_15355 [Candidatus Acidoferrum sp.]|nr:hypothetical protein [Candidatus Acidoferrum sp.]HXY79607.1 hypothetical protein [Candidatus Bathyarchaeia archaeon]